jgi:hypothetical protein
LRGRSSRRTSGFNALAWNRIRLLRFIFKSWFIRHRLALGDVALIGASMMEKLQEIVDAVFGAVDNQPAPLPPNEFTVQRQRVFDERARKIEALRRARLDLKASR